MCSCHKSSKMSCRKKKLWPEILKAHFVGTLRHYAAVCREYHNRFLLSRIQDRRLECWASYGGHHSGYGGTYRPSPRPVGDFGRELGELGHVHCRVSRHLCSTLGPAAAQTKGHKARTVLLNAQVQRELAAYGRAQEGCGGAGLMPLGSRCDFGHDR